MNLIDEKKYAELQKQARELADEGAMQAFIREVRKHYGFQHVGFSIVQREPVLSVQYQCTTYPAAWGEFYRSHSLDAIDPLVKQSTLPILWNKLGDITEPEIAVMYERARHGIGPNGLTIPTIGSDGRMSVLSMTENTLPEAVWSKRVVVLLREMQDVGMLMHTAYFHMEGNSPPPAVDLSERHIACIKMLGYGMPIASIARFSGMTEKSTKKYFVEAKKRLQANNNAQLIYNAMQAGLIK